MARWELGLDKNALVTTFNPNNLNQLSTVNRSGTRTVAGTTTRDATSVTVNSQTAMLYGDQTFAAPGFTVNDGNNTFSSVAQDNSNQPTTNTLSVYTPQPVSFQYDANGNLISDGRRAFSYDDENQLTQVTIGTTYRAEFVYDGLGRRRTKRDCFLLNGYWITNEVRYIHDGYRVLQERNASNQPKVTHTRGLDLSAGQAGLSGTLEGAGGIGGFLARTDQSSQTSTRHSSSTGRCRIGPTAHWLRQATRRHRNREGISLICHQNN